MTRIYEDCGAVLEFYPETVRCGKPVRVEKGKVPRCEAHKIKPLWGDHD